MFLVLVIAVVAVVICFKLGLFRKATQCEDCGKSIKGSEQRWYGVNNKFCLCKDCATKIPLIMDDYAKENWSYDDYKNYIKWNEETKEVRSKFNADKSYNGNLAIDIDNALFTFSSGKARDKSTVFRFKDISKFDIDFEPESIKQGLVGDKVVGTEYVYVEMDNLNFKIGVELKKNVSVKLKSKGFFKKEYSYEYTKNFADIKNTFIVLALLAYREYYDSDLESLDEYKEALETFSLDKIDDIRGTDLSQLKDYVIKNYKPNAGETNEEFLARIERSYELLRKLKE